MGIGKVRLNPSYEMVIQRPGCDTERDNQKTNSGVAREDIVGGFRRRAPFIRCRSKSC